MSTRPDQLELPQTRMVKGKTDTQVDFTTDDGRDDGADVRSIEWEAAEKILTGPHVRYITGLRNRLVLETMLYCGLRVGEVCGLKIRDVDLENRTIFIRKGKTKAARRHVMYPRSMDASMQTWVARRRAEIKVRSDWFFPTTTGNQLNTKYVYGMLQRMCDRVKVPRTHPHALRHTAALRQHKDGMPENLLQAWLGHEDPDMSRRYARASGRDVLTYFKSRGY